MDIVFYFHYKKIIFTQGRSGQ